MNPTVLLQVYQIKYALHVGLRAVSCRMVSSAIQNMARYEGTKWDSATVQYYVPELSACHIFNFHSSKLLFLNVLTIQYSGYAQ